MCVGREVTCGGQGRALEQILLLYDLQGHLCYQAWSHTHVTDTHIYTHTHIKIYIFKFKFSWWLIVFHGRCCSFSVFSFVGVGLSILEVCDLLCDNNGFYS